MKGDWDKLSPKQQAKVRGHCCNNWTDIEVYLQNFDKRDGNFTKRVWYKTILIKYKRNGKSHQSTVSAQVFGREK